MAMLLILFLVVSVFLVSASAGSSFDFTLGTPALWHSEVAYCNTSTYLSRNYVGQTWTFEPIAIIEDTKRSTEGYIGIQPNIQAIFVVFRGSVDFNNWLTNLDVITTSYPLCDKCAVHKGFYDAEQFVLPGIISTVKSLQAQHPTYTVIATGHSQGAALATLAAFDLMNAGVSNIKIFNFGSPRVGNTAFADWASGRIPLTRSTHYKDIVPHVPMHERFTHISGEVYEDLHSGGPLKDCSGHEDPTCSYQWHVTSVDDHLLYQGLVLGGAGCQYVS